LSRIRIATFVAALLVALAALVAGCGGSEEPASPAALVTDSLKAVREQKPIRYRFNVQARTDEVVPAPGAGEDVRRLAQSPLALGLSGGYSPEALEAKGNAQYGGQTFTADALAGPRELYVRFLGQWYGTKETGLDDLRRQAESRSGRSSDQAFDQALRSIERQGPRVFRGEVTEGPELDGTSTWQTQGTLNAQGLEQIAREQGQQVTANDRRALEQLARATRLTYIVGQDDQLPRRIRLSLDLRPQDFAQSARKQGRQLRQLERLRASLTADMSAWGEEVELRPPGRFQPLEQLLQQFLGGGAGGGAVPQPG
jgi:hypothetical protein